MPNSSITRIARFTLVTNDIDAIESFFVEAFDCKPLGRRKLGPAEADMMGVPGARIEQSIVGLGTQEVAFLTFDPPGSTYPHGTTSSDLWFQHFAIIVSDIDAAYARLEAIGRFTPISEGGIQVLPPASGSVSAFKFRDAEGHPLEFLSFPPGKGPQAWESKRSAGLFLGIDHSAIAVSDTARSVAFFEKALGLKLGPQTENHGTEQSRMDAVPDARVTVSGLEPDQVPPHVELLGYKVGDRRPIDGKTMSSDIAATHFVLETTDLPALVESLITEGARFVSPGIVTMEDHGQAVMILDPDGHRFVIRQSAP